MEPYDCAYFYCRNIFWKVLADDRSLSAIFEKFHWPPSDFSFSYVPFSNLIVSNIPTYIEARALLYLCFPFLPGWATFAVLSFCKALVLYLFLYFSFLLSFLLFCFSDCVVMWLYDINRNLISSFSAFFVTATTTKYSNSFELSMKGLSSRLSQRLVQLQRINYRER